MYYPPPPWGYGPPPSAPNMTDDHFKRGIIFASKLAAREEREKERKKFREKKDKEEIRNQVNAARSRVLTSLEWFILGIIAYPFVGPMYTAATHAAKVWGAQ